MLRFFVRRGLQGCLVVACVTIVVFFVTRLLADPVAVMAPIDATTEQRDAIAAEYGLDEPVLTQFGTYIADLASGDLGESFWQRRPALDIVMQALPNTLLLAGAGMFLALLVAIPLGVFAALRPGSVADRIASTFGLLGLSAPQFWVGLLLILVFSVNLGWLPTSGLGGIDSLTLPAITIALPAAGRLSVLTRSTMIDEMNRPWVKVAHAKGMPARRVIGRHALRNALVPLVTLGGWEAIRMLAGATVIVETVFAWPGVGTTALDAVERNDLFLLQAIVLVIAVVTVLANILIDLAYRAIDPRIELEAL